MTIIFSKREIKKDKEKSNKNSYKDLAMYMYRKTFMPEIKPELLPYEEKYWNKVFPKEGPKGQISENDFKKLMISNIGGYSIFLPKYANSMAKVLRSYFPDNEKVTITDATSNMGGAVLGFCRYFDKVNAVEIVDLHCNILRNNMKLYKVDDQVNIICDDYIDVYKNTKQDIIFFDPPWGGVDYKKNLLMNLNLGDFNMDKIIMDIKENKQKSLKKDQPLIIALRVPYNYDFKRMFKIHDKINIHSFFKDNKVLSSVLICITL